MATLGRVRRILANPAHRFVALFAVLLAAEAVVYPIATRRWFAAIDGLTRATARVAYRLLHAVSDSATLDGKRVALGAFSVQVIEECTGIFEILIFTAAVAAFPTTPGRKAIGLLLGVPLLWAFNVARILVLLGVGHARPGLFEFMHVYFWQATLILMITSVWLLWILAVVRRAG